MAAPSAIEGRISEAWSMPTGPASSGGRGHCRAGNSRLRAEWLGTREGAWYGL